MMKRLSAFAVVLMCGVTGCGPEVPQAAAPVEPETARAALKSTLDAWKAGRKPAVMATAIPPIVAQDMDWAAGVELADYTLLDDTPLDANLQAKVKLTVRSTGGKEATKTVTYVVGTDPKITVFRALE